MTDRPYEQPRRTAFVIAPDIILDLIKGNRGAGEAALLFDAIAADIVAGNDTRPAYIASITVPTISWLAKTSVGPVNSGGILMDLLRLVKVASLNNADYQEALGFTSVEYDEALQFVTCRVVGAKYLVTRNDYGLKRTPVQRRTAGEMLPFFRG